MNQISITDEKKTSKFSFCEEPFLGKNRDRVSLIAAILQASNGGATKTRIMLNANLSVKLLEKYLYTAIRFGFIHQIESHYILTTKRKRIPKRIQKPKPTTQRRIKNPKITTTQKNTTKSQCQENPPQIQIRSRISKNREAD